MSVRAKSGLGKYHKIGDETVRGVVKSPAKFMTSVLGLSMDNQ